MKKLYLAIGAVFLVGLVSGQDIHFSQFDAAPMNLNPALTGGFEGDYRFIANQRSQWSSVTTPYSTIGFSTDANEPLNTKNTGAGIGFYHDIAGDSRFRTLKVDLSGSYSKFISSDSSHQLTAGIQVGFKQKQLSYQELEFNNQYNGYKYDPKLSNGEQFDRNQRSYFDANAGLAYTYDFGRRKRIDAGVALFNLFKPRQSLFNNRDIRLDRRMTLFGKGSYPISSDMNLHPSVFFGAQGTYRELIGGTSVEYILRDELGLYRSIYGGIWYRTRDAGYVIIGMRYDEWKVGASYDINTSDLRTASNGKGGFELSIQYILTKYERPQLQYKTCPTFL